MASIRTFNPLISRLLRSYYLGPNHPFKIRLYGAIQRFLGNPRLTLPYATRSWLTLDIKDYVQNNIFFSGAYEPEVWYALKPLIEKNEILWDVGAHIGSFGIRAGEESGIDSVYFFEPIPSLVEVIDLHVKLNNQGKFHILPIALSDQSGIQNFYLGPDENLGYSSLDSTKPDLGKAFKVAVKTADEIIQKRLAPPPTLLKIDIERSEESFLKGATELFSKTPPKGMVIELSVDNQNNITSPTITQFFKDNHYTVRHVKRAEGVDEVENFLVIRNDLLPAYEAKLEKETGSTRK